MNGLNGHDLALVRASDLTFSPVSQELGMLAGLQEGVWSRSHVARCALERLSSPGLTALVGSQPRLITPSAAPVKPMDSSTTSTLAAPPCCASPGPGQRRCASNLHNVLSWVVYEEYFYSTAPSPEKRGIHHKVSPHLGMGLA